MPHLAPSHRHFRWLPDSLLLLPGLAQRSSGSPVTKSSHPAQAGEYAKPSKSSSANTHGRLQTQTPYLSPGTQPRHAQTDNQHSQSPGRKMPRSSASGATQPAQPDSAAQPAHASSGTQPAQPSQASPASLAQPSPASQHRPASQPSPTQPCHPTSPARQRSPTGQPTEAQAQPSPAQAG